MLNRPQPRGQGNSGAPAGRVQTMANLSPKKPANGTVRMRTESFENRTPDKQAQVNALRQEVRLLEIQMAASVRVRHHLEGLLREMTAELISW